MTVKPVSDSSASGLVAGAWVARRWHSGVLRGVIHVEGSDGKTLCNRSIDIWWFSDIVEASGVGCECCRKRMKPDKG
jgi:hypothetical protein